ncbi:MAG: hypothetical protein R3B52_00155 [Candidatus Paceibacterota bacterium]
MTIQNDQFEIDRLFHVGDFAAAKKLLESYLNSDLSIDEKADAYTAFVTAYMKMVAKINAAYEATLDNILQDLKLIDDKEKNISDKFSLALLNKNIEKHGRS